MGKLYLWHVYFWKKRKKEVSSEKNEKVNPEEVADEYIENIPPEEYDTGLESPKPPELLNHQNFEREPELEPFDDTRLVDSVDVMEIEFTDVLLAYNMSDETIDEIFERVRADSVENNEDLD